MAYLPSGATSAYRSSTVVQEAAVIAESSKAEEAPFGCLADIDPVLRIRNISHIYATGVQALMDVSLDVPRGMYGLLGRNGAAKSSLMRILATLQEPSAGSVTFDGFDILAEPLRLRSVLGYLPQEFGVYPNVSAEELLDHLAVLKGIGPVRTR